MPETLHWNTVTALLQSGLRKLMQEPLFDQFRLVGGTSLSLQTGHRLSIDIDLFTDAAYDSIDFQEIDDYLRQAFNYVSPSALPQVVGFGMSYIIGNSHDDAFKLDLYYTDPFIRSAIEKDNVRLATREEIIAMKIDVVQRRGRKKDFWDIHELLETHTINQMIALHEERYPYNHDEALIRANMMDFSSADLDFDPVCLRGKLWEIIKLDIVDALNG